jgi:hypothetical protein
VTKWTPGVISLLVPSRGRPEMCAQMWNSACGNAGDPQHLELVLYLDDDDPTVDRYLEQTLHWPTSIVEVRGPRIVLSQTWNRCYEQAAGEILWHGNDDIRFNTQGWDRAIRQAFAEVADRILLVHGNDGIQGRNLATHGFLHRRWPETVGYFVPPHYASDYNDTHISEVADRLGRRRYLPELDIEHLHPVAGKAPLDQTHRDRLERHRLENVDVLYASKAHERVRDAELLRTVMDGAAAKA